MCFWCMFDAYIYVAAEISFRTNGGTRQFKELDGTWRMSARSIGKPSKTTQTTPRSRMFSAWTSLLSLIWGKRLSGVRKSKFVKRKRMRTRNLRWKSNYLLCLGKSPSEVITRGIEGGSPWEMGLEEQEGWERRKEAPNLLLHQTQAASQVGQTLWPSKTKTKFSFQIGIPMCATCLMWSLKKATAWSCPAPTYR